MHNPVPTDSTGVVYKTSPTRITVAMNNDNDVSSISFVLAKSLIFAVI